MHQILSCLSKKQRSHNIIGSIQPENDMPSPGESGKDFSQSKYVAAGVIFQFALPQLAIGVSSCVPLCKSFEHM